jgi:hypothetical protein
VDSSGGGSCALGTTVGLKAARLDCSSKYSPIARPDGPHRWFTPQPPEARDQRQTARLTPKTVLPFCRTPRPESHATAVDRLYQ